MLDTTLIKNVAEKIDNLVDWSKIIGNKIVGSSVEMVDGMLIKWGLNYLNEHFADKIPTQYQDEIVTALQCFVDGDYTGMLSAIPDGLAEAIDIAAFDDDFEAVFISTNFNAMVKFAVYYAQKQLSK